MKRHRLDPDVHYWREKARALRAERDNACAVVTRLIHSHEDLDALLGGSIDPEVEWTRIGLMEAGYLPPRDDGGDS